MPRLSLVAVASTLPSYFAVTVASETGFPALSRTRPLAMEAYLDSFVKILKTTVTTEVYFVLSEKSNVGGVYHAVAEKALPHPEFTWTYNVPPEYPYPSATIACALDVLLTPNPHGRFASRFGRTAFWNAELSGFEINTALE